MLKTNLFLLISLTFSLLSFSQNKTGYGNVSNDAGVLIPNAIVQISPVSDTSLIYQYVCDKNGNYAFDIASSDSVFVLNILPSNQTLQFHFDEEQITLSNGNNGICFHKVLTTNSNGIRLTIVDTLGNPVSGAKVLLYESERKWRIDSCSIIKPVYTDSNGQVEIRSLLPIKYWFNVRKDYMSNRFTDSNTSAAVDTTVITGITDTIRDLSQNEFYMCGLCDNKVWITDSMVIFGMTQNYDADSKLLSDGTWYDSNDNHGYWWFSADQSQMTYNYDTNSANGGGSEIVATLIALTENYFAGDMTMFGLPVTYYMSPIYDTVNLHLSAQDTTLILDSNGVAGITPDDLMITSDYCFSCNITLSQSAFDVSDAGDIEVYVTLEDRCGNLDIDTITITIVQPLSVNELKKSNFRMFPNPGNDYVVIEGNERIKRIDVFDVLGNFIKQFAVNNDRFIIDTSDLNRGMYLFRIYTTNGVVSNRLIVE